MLQSLDMTKYHYSLHSSFTNNFPNSFVIFYKDKEGYQWRQDQVVRLSESSYGKGFVIFQVVLPLILQYFLLCNYANFGNTGPRIFVFVSASLNCPDFLFHIIIVSGPNFITGLIWIWYYTYQDPFSASEVTQFLPFSEVRKMPLFQRDTKPHK